MHTYETRHRVEHAAGDMFGLVADIEQYPKFLPLCEDVKVKNRSEREGNEVLTATMAVGYKLIRERFTTEVILDRANRIILVGYLDGPFSFLENRWRFHPLSERACEIEFYIGYSFRSRMLERVMGGLFAAAVRKYTHAFEARADVLFTKTTKRVSIASQS